MSSSDKTTTSNSTENGVITRGPKSAFDFYIIERHRAQGHKQNSSSKIPKKFIYQQRIIWSNMNTDEKKTYEKMATKKLAKQKERYSCLY